MRILIMGAGDVGKFLAGHYSGQSHDVVLIDIDEKALAEIEEAHDVMTFEGDATHRHILKALDVGSCGLFISVSGNDAVNLVAASLAGQMGAKRTVARVDTPEFFSTQYGIEREILGVSAVICASRLVSHEIIRMIRSIDCDSVTNYSENMITSCIFEVADGFRHLNKAPKEIELGRKAEVVGLIREYKWYKPVEIAKIYEGDQLVVCGDAIGMGIALKRLSEQFEGKSLVIIGGGDVGGEIMRNIAQESRSLQVIDIDYDRCETLSETFENVSIVHGDGTNINVLQDERVGDADCIISVTKADEVNLMSTLLGKDIGVRSAFSLVHRPGYAKVYKKLGVTGTTGSHDLFAKMVEWITTEGFVIHTEKLSFCDKEIVEVYIPNCELAGEFYLSDLSLPSHAYFIGGHAEGNFIHFNDNCELKSRMYLLFSVQQGKAQEIEKAFKKIKKKG